MRERRKGEGEGEWEETCLLSSSWEGDGVQRQGYGSWGLATLT